jgi:hypothetical protein
VEGSGVLTIALSLAAGLAWLALALAAGPRAAGRVAIAAAATAALGAAAAAAGRAPLAAPPPTLAGLAFAVGAWSVPAAGHVRTFRRLAVAAGILALGAGAFALSGAWAPVETAAGFGWLALSDAALTLAAGSVLASALGVEDGPPDPGLAARTALVLGVLGLVAYGVGAQRALGAYAPGTPSMSHRLAVLLAIGPVAHEGGAGRAARLAAGLLCVALLLAQAPLAAWLHPEGVAIYP